MISSDEVPANHNAFRNFGGIHPEAASERRKRIQLDRNPGSFAPSALGEALVTSGPRADALG
jgi:hypothetical protein